MGFDKFDDELYIKSPKKSFEKKEKKSFSNTTQHYEGDICPKCKKGELVIRSRSKKDNDDEFLGCSCFPKCKFTSSL